MWTARMRMISNPTTSDDDSDESDKEECEDADNDGLA
jgi:hypothetical protein